MERKPDNIHELLGSLRRRVSELIKGDYSRGYKDEMAAVKIHVESFDPIIIVNNLKTIYDDLILINDDIYRKVSDELYDIDGIDNDEVPEINYTGESRRDLMRKEVMYYISELKFYIDKYSAFLPSTAKEEVIRQKSKGNVIRYEKYAKDPQRLANLHNALHNHIEEISLRDFQKIFSGKDQIIENPINWKRDHNELRYFLQKLFKHDSIEGSRINWEVVKNCFRFKGAIIEGKNFKHHSRKPSRSSLLDNIIRNL